MIKRNPLEEWYDDKKTIYDISECGMVGVNILKQPILISSVDYCSSRGEKTLIDQLCKIYNCQTSNVLITNGATEAIYILMRMLIDERNTESKKIIYQTPYFSSLENCVTDTNIKVCKYKLKKENRFTFVFDDLIKLIDEDVLGLLVNFPNNPTGCSLSSEGYEELFALARDNDFYVIFDETTALIIKGTYVENNIYKNLDNCICVNSVSKSFGLPGLRIGWIIANETVIEKCQAIKETISTCSASIMQTMASKVLELRDVFWTSHREIIDRNIQYFWERSKQVGIDLSNTKISSDGMCCFIELPNYINSKEFSQKLYEDYKVLVTPGECFNIPHYVRVGFGVSENIFIYAINSFLSILKEDMQDVYDKGN